MYVHVYVYMNMCIYVCTRISAVCHEDDPEKPCALTLNIHTHTNFHIYQYTNMCVHIYTYTYTCSYIYMYVSRNLFPAVRHKVDPKKLRALTRTHIQKYL